MTEAAPDATLQEFGRRLRAARTALGLNQDDFADLVGVHRSYVGPLENGKKDLRLSTLYRLARALNIDPKTLLP